MKQLQSAAFDAADEYCKCEELDNCFANSFMDGYIAGFLACREMAAKDAERHPFGSHLIGNSIRQLGEGQSK